jgi:glycosyltransferase involved in cell wall biosynthesis
VSELAISVIMPVYNGRDFIARSLPPLLAMEARGEVLEVMVVDDGSTDGTDAMAREMGARVLPSGGRLGPGGARNEAAHHAKGNILWFIDADVIPHPDAAVSLLAGFDAEDVVAVFGSYDEDPPAQNFFSRYKNLVHHYYHQRAREEAVTFWSGCGAVRREAFLAVQGFDVERYKHPSIEDIELGHRMIRAGGRIRMRRDVLCTHLKVWEFGNLVHTEIFRRAIPWSRLIVSAGEGIPDDLNVGRGEQVRAVIAGLFLLALVAFVLGQASLMVVLVMFAVVLVANWSITRMFAERGGVLFAVGALLYHQFYYLYSAASFAWVVAEQWACRLLGRSAPR